MFGFTGCRLCATEKFKDNSRAQNSVEQTGENRSAPTQGTLRALEGKIRSENYNSAYKPAPKLAWEKIGFLANQDLPVFPANSREPELTWELKSGFVPNFFAWELPAPAQNWSLISWRNNWAFRNNRRTSFFQTNAANTLFQLMPMPAWLQKASMLAEESQWLKTIVSRESINTEHIVRQICFITVFLQNHLVLANARRQNQLLRAASMITGFCSDFWSKMRCNHLAQASRCIKAESQSAAIRWRAWLQDN
jgi:hypothetical protein